MSKLVRRLLTGKPRRVDALITALVGPNKTGGWSVSWVGDGACPADIDASSLTEAVDQASSAAAALYAAHPPVTGAELQLALYPWDYQGGEMFDISGEAGALTARDIQESERSVAGETLEDLVEAVRRMSDIPTGRSMFRWIRPIGSLPTPPPRP